MLFGKVVQRQQFSSRMCRPDPSCATYTAENTLDSSDVWLACILDYCMLDTRKALKALRHLPCTLACRRGSNLHQHTVQLAGSINPCELARNLPRDISLDSTSQAALVKRGFILGLQMSMQGRQAKV